MSPHGGIEFARLFLICAKITDEPPLFKGSDFKKTDILPAL